MKTGVKYTILLAVSVSITLFGTVFGLGLFPLFASASLAATALTCSKKQTAAAYIITAAVPAISGFWTLASVSLPLVLLSLLIVFCASKRFSFCAGNAVLCAFILIYLLSMFAAVKYTSGDDVFKNIIDDTYRSMVSIADNELAAIDPDAAEQYKLLLSSVFVAFEAMLPSILIIMSMIAAFFIYTLAGFLLRLCTSPFDLPELRYMHFSKTLPIGFAVFLAAYLFMQNSVLSYATVNVVLILGFLLTMNAMSLISLFLYMHNIPSVARFFIYLGLVLLVMFPFTFYLFVGLGAYEAMAGLKQRIENGGGYHE